MRVLEVFEAVASSGRPIPLAEVVSSTGLPSTTAHRCLRVLADAGWVRTASGGGRPKWEVTTRLRLLAGGGDAALAAVAAPVLARRAVETGEAWQLWVADGRSIGVVAAADAPGPLRAGWAIGERLPIHTSAGGKAVLCGLPDVEVRRLVGAAPVALTMRTIVDAETLLVDLRAARRTGYAVARAEEAEGVTSVGAAVGGDAAVSVTGPSDRMDGRLAELGAVVVSAAREIGRERL